MINEIEKLREFCAKKQEFNIFKVLKLENYEIRHSNFLAWLLNPNSSHGIKNLFLKKFINKIDKKLSYDENDIIEIHREKDNIDILLLNDTKKYLLLIENKINSNQHDNQLKRYEEITSKKYGDYDKKYIYLKPEENEVIPENYLYISYKDIVEIIKDIEVKNNEVNTLLKHFTKIFDERYEEINGETLLDICVKIIEQNKLDLLNSEERDIVLSKAEYRRYQIIKALAEILSSNKMLNVPEQNSVYKVKFEFKPNYQKDYLFYEFDNTDTKENSQIVFKAHKEHQIVQEMFLDVDEYNKIFYTYGENSYTEIKEKLSQSLNSWLIWHNLQK